MTGSNNGSFFLGLDGGASKTAGALVDANGRILGRCRAAGSAIVGKPSAEACLILSSIVDELCRQADVARQQLGFCGIGLSGVDFPDEHSWQKNEIAQAIQIPLERLALVNDGIIALWGATSAPAAVSIQHGTGFTAAFRSQPGGETLFDHLDVGKTFDLRAELLSVVARMIDGRLAPTPLKEKVLEHFRITVESRYSEVIYRSARASERLQSTPSVVFRSWLADDPAASLLVRQAVEDYALTAKTMVGRTDSVCPDVTFGGGLIAQAPQEFWNLLSQRIRQDWPSVTVKSPDLPPECGAAVMAASQLGHQPQSFFQTVRNACLRCKETTPHPQQAEERNVSLHS